MKKKLSPRLLAMARHVAAGERIADIGSDHAYLPRYLVAGGISPRAVLTDVRPGPLARAGASAGMEAMPDRFDLRLGRGLEPLRNGEVETVVIAGMGGETIAAILAADPVKAASFPKYILQPRTKAGTLRDWLSQAGWSVLADETAEERGRECVILVAAPKKESGS